MLLRPSSILRRPFSTQTKVVDSFLSGTSAIYAEQMLELYERDPNSVEPSWKRYFDSLEQGENALEDKDFQNPTMAASTGNRVTAAVSLLQATTNFHKHW